MAQGSGGTVVRAAKSPRCLTGRGRESVCWGGPNRRGSWLQLDVGVGVTPRALPSRTMTAE